MRLPEMTPRQQEIFSYCEKYFFAHEDPSQMIKNAHFFRDGYDAYGLTEPELKELRDTMLEGFNPDVHEIADLAEIFFATGKYEFGSLAFMMLKKHRPRFDRYVYEAIFRIMEKGIENWAHCDLFSQKITPVFLELGIASVEDFAAWRDSSCRWTRRCGIQTMLYLRDKASPEMLLEFAVPMLGEQDRMAQQGLGVFLRELWKLHSEEVEEYLYVHKEDIPRVVMQFASEKMARDKKKRLHRTSAERKPNRNNNRDRKPRNNNQENSRQNTQKPGNRHVHPRQDNAKSHFLKQNLNKKQRFKPNTADPDPVPTDEDDFGDWDNFDLKNL